MGESTEALFAVTIPERPGSLKRFCETMGRRSLTEFNYRISDSTRAHIFVGVGVAGTEDSEKIAAHFRKAGFELIDLTHNDLAAQHVRHMVGGSSALADGELVFDVEFPERPGALMKFLLAMPADWNVSMFHYRNQGGDSSRVLVGLQVPRADRRRAATFFVDLGYPARDVTADPVYQMFLA